MMQHSINYKNSNNSEENHLNLTYNRITSLRVTDKDIQKKLLIIRDMVRFFTLILIL